MPVHPPDPPKPPPDDSALGEKMTYIAKLINYRKEIKKYIKKYIDSKIYK